MNCLSLLFVSSKIQSIDLAIKHMHFFFFNDLHIFNITIKINHIYFAVKKVYPK
jgi:hypothetical protein